MKYIITMGEAIVDMMPMKNGIDIDNDCFVRHAGGAPLNVACATAKLGVPSTLISAVGEDFFGDFLIDELKKNNVGIAQIKRTKDYLTPLAFVSISIDGERDFAFYRNNTADMHIYKTDISRTQFKYCYAFHFGSVALVESATKYSHLRAIESCRKYSAIISFDFNIRLPLFPDKNELRRTLWQFIPLCNILKLNEEELEFIAEGLEKRQIIDKLFCGDVKLIFITRGSKGAECYTKTHMADVSHIIPVKVADTTGAGDAFIAAFLAFLYKDNIKLRQLDTLIERELYNYLNLACIYATKSTENYGAVSSYLTLDEFEKQVKLVDKSDF